MHLCRAITKRSRLCFVARGFVKLRQIIQALRCLRMFRSAGLLGNFERVQRVGLGFFVISFLAIENAEIIERSADLVVVRSEFVFKKF